MPTPALSGFVAALASRREPTDTETADAMNEVIRLFVGATADLTRIADSMEKLTQPAQYICKTSTPAEGA